MDFFGKLFKGKNSNSKKSKKNKKRSKKQEAVFYFNSQQQKFRTLAKREYTVSEFQERYGVQEPEYKTTVRANVVIIYDIDAPNGEGGKNNKLYVHFLRVGKKVIMPYKPPSPKKGTHNYFAVSLKIDESEITKQLEELDDGERNPELLQDLHQKKKIADLEITKAHMLKITSFRIKQDAGNNNQGNNNNKPKNNKKSKKSNKKKSRNESNKNNLRNSQNNRSRNTNTTNTSNTMRTNSSSSNNSVSQGMNRTNNSPRNFNKSY